MRLFLNLNIVSIYYELRITYNLFVIFDIFYVKQNVKHIRHVKHYYIYYEIIIMYEGDK